MNRIVKKPEERRQEIVLAARELFLKKDYEKTTMEDVMKKVEVAKGTIYHYFKSKEDLLEAVVQDRVDEYIEGVQAALDEAKGSALDRMRILVSAGRVADQLEEELEDLHRAGNIGMHARQLAVTILKLAPLYAEVIQQGCDEGIFQVEKPLEVAEFLLAGIQFMTDVGCYSWSDEDLQRREGAIANVIESQLGAPKGSFEFLS